MDHRGKSRGAGQQRTQSISRALLYLLVVGILVPAALIWAIGHATARSAVGTLWDGLAAEIADHTVERTRRFLETGESALSYNASAVQTQTVDPAARESLLEYLLAGLRANPNVTWYSFGGADGAYLSAYRSDGRIRLTWREQVGSAARYRDYFVLDDGAWQALPEQTKPYDPRTRVWYEAAVKTDAAVWSKPFLFASGPPGFILSKQARDRDGALIGVWGIEYEMAYVSEFLASLEIGETGRAYLLTAAGEVIGHPEAGGNIAAVEGWISVHREGKKAIATAVDHRDPWLQATYARIGAADFVRGDGALEVDGRTLLWTARAFPPETGLDWRVAIVVPEDELLGAINRSSLHGALLAVLITGIFLALALIGARRRVSQPLAGIARDLERMSQLDTEIEPHVQQSRLTEVADMVAAREVMRSGLRSFKKYVPVDLVRELMAEGHEAVLGGEERELTVMFSDIADFTTISESLDGPDALVSALGEYLDVMSNAILIRDGTVDKYIGDMIMAFWGAPKPVANHALLACEAAWDSQQALRVLRYRWERDGLPPFHARIGVNTGTMTVGNIGSSNRMNYTVMGDPVNLGSRLEGVCKIYGIETAIGQTTWAAAGERFEGRPVDCVEVKGQSQAVVFYELLGPKGDVEDQVLEFGGVYAEAFAQYRAREFETARAGFQRALGIRPDDVAARVLLERCEAYARTPPPEDWSGAVRLTRK